MPGQRTRHPLSWDRDRRVLIGLVLFALGATVLALWGLVLLGQRDPIFAGRLGLRFLRLVVFRLPLALAEELPWQIVVARVALPASVSLLALHALLRVLRRPIESFAAARERDHVVLCGSGRHLPAIVKNLAGAGHRTVVLRSAAGANQVVLPPAAGAIDLRGAPTDEHELERAAVAHARAVLAIDDDDAANLAVGLAVDAHVARRRRPAESPVPCILFIRDDGMRQAIGSQPLGRTTSMAVELRLVCPELDLTRLLLHDHPLDRFADTAGGQPLNILIVGANPMGEQILLEVLRSGQYGGAMSVTVADDEVASRSRAFRDRYAQASRACALSFVSIDLEAPHASFIELLERLAGSPLTSVYLCAEGRDRNVRLAAALRAVLRQRLAHVPPIYVYETEHQQLLDYLRAAGPSVAPEFIAFGSDRSTEVFSAEFLLSERLDALARAVHEAYLEESRRQGKESSGSLAGLPWRRLPETFRDASRHQAAHIEIKLRSIGCSSIEGPPVTTFVFSDRELESCARLEHLRWMAERHLEGWVFGQSRDDLRRHHPLLVPYEDLPEPIKEYDRAAVRNIPSLLARVGRSVRRDLVVGVVGSSRVGDLTADLDRLVDQQFDRLRSTFSDRRLVVMSPLCDPVSRRIAQLALQRPDVRLRVVLATPLDSSLENLGDPNEVASFRELLARSERWFPLWEEPVLREPDDRLAAFLAERSEVLMAVRPHGEDDPRSLAQRSVARWQGSDGGLIQICPLSRTG